MARTWEKTKSGKLRKADPRSRVDAIAARRVLRDVCRARHELAIALRSGTQPERRLRWVTTVTLLRVVGHVLKNIDARRSSELATAVKIAWDRWVKCSFDHLIFHEFIEKERNFILKEYRSSMPVPEEALPELSRDGAAPFLLVGDKAYSAVEAIDAAIAWWEAELEQVEIECGNDRLAKSDARSA